MLLSALIAGVLSGAAQTPDADERLLTQHQVAVDDAGLLRFFRDRTLRPEQVNALKADLRELGSARFNVREKAAANLVKAGLNAKALLLEITQNPATDLEIGRRAELCLRQIDDGQEVALAQAAARLLARRKLPEAAAALINYVPFAGDPHILHAVQDALNVVAVIDGRVDTTVLQAVHDSHANKRTAAGVALVRAGGLMQKAAVSHLLEDRSLKVRLPITMALVEKEDKEAVPILIERLGDVPADQIWQVADLLERIAGEKGPGVYPSSRVPPAKVRAAWQQWWLANAATVDLAKLAKGPTYLGYTLISQMGAKTSAGSVLELRPDRSKHWEIPNLSYPVDARVIGPNRVLIAEYLGRRVTERDFEGKILWEVPMEMPIACQRTAEGDTFIATRRQLVMVDADKRTTFSHPFQNGSISAAHRTRDGQMVFVASTGQCHWLDAQGREQKSFPVGYVYPLGGSIEVLSNRRLLAPLFRDGKVAEFDADGKMVWHTAVQSPVSATRLPNGHTLVITMSNLVVELDREGQTVWRHSTEGRAWRARGR
jgi:hypothetical protein